MAHFGELDDAKGFSDVATAHNLEAEFKKHSKQIELVIWPGAQHAFMNRDNLNRYNPDIAKQAREKTVSFLRKVLA
jgi:carboxymethylenebutenolidase